MPKNTVIRVATIWLASVPALLGILLAVSPQRYAPVAFVLIAFEMLLFYLSITLVRKETVVKNKPIFVNFALFSGLAFVFYLELLLGDWLTSVEQYFQVYYAEYVLHSAYFFLLGLAVVYVSVDALLREFSTAKKYAITLGIVGGMFLLYYHPFLTDPMHPYQTPEVQDLRTVRIAAEQLPDATPEQIADAVELKAWYGTEQGAPLPPADEVQRVSWLLPYNDGQSHSFLVYGPLHRNDVYMSVLCVAFILLFFGYQYMKDPPQGAYIEKIMFLFLVFSSLEALHAWSYVKSMDWSFARETFKLGNYMSLAVLVPIVVYFGARLNFITSVKGEYYEQELASRPAGITRWRDALDDLIIDRFFNRKAIIGRMLVDPNRK